MFGRSKRVVFDPYRGRRSRARVPGWLWLLLAGVVAGAGGVIAAQERWLPPRLSAAESTRLRQDYAQADADRVRLQRELEAASSQLQASRAGQESLQKDRDALAARVAGFDENLAFVVDALPPDPRGGTVAVRAARFTARGDALHYDLALSHEHAGPRAIAGVMQLVVAGAPAGAGSAGRSVELQPVEMQIARQHVARGLVPLPSGFTPRQVTVRLLDRAGGRLLGMRVLGVR